MVYLQPDVKDSIRYSRKETLRILGIASKTLAIYEAEALIQPGIKWGREKLYTGAMIKQCWRNYRWKYGRP